MSTKKLNHDDKLVYDYVKKTFKKGVALPYVKIGSNFGMSAEWARRHAINLGGKIKRSHGRIVGVK